MLAAGIDSCISLLTSRPFDITLCFRLHTLTDQEKIRVDHTELITIYTNHSKLRFVLYSFKIV